MNHPALMPVSIFTSAVKLACASDNPSEDAVSTLTAWWNQTVSQNFAHAFSLSLCVDMGDYWLSGLPEEGRIEPAQWSKGPSDSAKASLLSGKIHIVFLSKAVDDDLGFYAKAVDGSHGFSGGKSASEGTGNDILLRYAHEELSVFPIRFPDVWRDLCEQGSCN